MAKHNVKGRSKSGGPSFLQLHRWMLESPAWASLGVYSRCLYLELKRRYFGNNNGGISMSHREAQALLGCSNRPVMAAFQELQSKGFIKATQKGAFKGVPMATTWLLTELPKDVPVKSLSATKEFMEWRPVGKPAEQKARCADSIPAVCPEHTADSSTVCPEHTDNVPRAHGKELKPPSPSVPRAYTYNSTISPSAEAASALPSNRQARDAAAPKPEPLGAVSGRVLASINTSNKNGKERRDASEYAGEIQLAAS